MSVTNVLKGLNYTSPATDIVRIEQVSKSFPSRRKEIGKLQVLKDISFRVHSNEVVAVIGPSGCGKTTLMRIIAGLEQKDSGSITINGKEVTSAGPDRGLVFQTFNLFPWMTVRDNVEFGLQKLDPSEKLEISQRFIKLVGLEGFEMFHPHELSGGMQQRVGIARALAIDPAVLLLDEPLANVDAQTAEKLIDELLKILQETMKTTIYVTHNMDEAIYSSDRIVVLSPRPGTVKEIYDVNLPKPRYEHDVRSLPEFGHLRSKLRKALGLAS